MSLNASHRHRFLLIALAVTVIGTAAAFVLAPRGEVVLHREVSKFQTLVVAEQGGRRCLRFGDGPQALNQTCRILREPRRVELDYARAIVALALSIEPFPKRVLVIGLGGGSIPTALMAAHPDVELDAVELDPAVVEVAANYFDFQTTKNVHVFAEDGVAFVARAAKSDEHYDLIVLDAFDESEIPAPLTTAEFVAQLQQLAGERGVVIANSFAGAPPKAFSDFKFVDVNRNRLLYRGPVTVPREATEALEQIGADDEWLKLLR